MTPLLWRMSRRYLARHPWQAALSIVGVAVGVAVVVAIDLANTSASRAFELSMESVVGRATHQIIGGPTGLSENVYRDLKLAPLDVPIAPVIEADVSVPTFPGRSFKLFGVDPFSEQPFRPFLNVASDDVGAFVTAANAVFLAAETAQAGGLDVGDEFEIRVGAERKPVRVAGLIRPDDELSRRAVEHLIVTDIATAQELLNAVGSLSRIDVRITEGNENGAGFGHDVDEAMEKETGAVAGIRRRLPPGITIVRATARTSAIEQMTRAFNLNLAALSMLALIVGMFLIYNTMTFSVVQRRPLIGSLRALGVTRREIFGLVLGEAAWIGTIGTGLGILLGIGLARVLVGYIAQTINDLYFAVSVTELAVPALALAKGAILGVAATIFAAMAPAFEATTTTPRTAQSRSAMESRAKQRVPRATVAGVAMLVGGIGIFQIPSRDLALAYAGLALILLGSAFLTPMITVLAMALARPVVGASVGVVGRMAARGVVATLSRTAVAIAALMVAISATVGVGVMVASFRSTVVQWLDFSLQADVYIRPQTQVQARTEAVLDPAIVKLASEIPGVVAVNSYRSVSVQADSGAMTQVLTFDFDERGHAAFRFKAGHPDEVWPAFHSPTTNGVLVTEPYAFRHGTDVGDEIGLRTDRGPRQFRVLGVVYDYASDRGAVMMHRATYNQFFDDRRVASIGLFAAPGADVDGIVTAVQTAVAGDFDVVVRSNRALREHSLAIFDRTFAITGVLRLLAMIVAFIGVLSALMALELERAREMAVLRAVGLTPKQVWGLVATETGLMGLVAGLVAIPVGLALAAVLIFVINRRSFGWTLQMDIAPSVLLQAVILAVVAALVAGIYPARKMARTSPAAALRDE